MGIEVAGEKGSRFVDDHLESQEISRIEESGEEAEAPRPVPWGRGHLSEPKHFPFEFSSLSGRMRRNHDNPMHAKTGERQATGGDRQQAVYPQHDRPLEPRRTQGIRRAYGRM